MSYRFFVFRFLIIQITNTTKQGTPTSSNIPPVQAALVKIAIIITIPKHGGWYNLADIWCHISAALADSLTIFKIQNSNIVFYKYL